jgi:hypothetical protein
MSAPEDRGPNIQCGQCGGTMRFVRGQSRCVDEDCPLYWQGQGGMETLTPNPPPDRVVRESQPMIRKPQDT